MPLVVPEVVVPVAVSPGVVVPAGGVLPAVVPEVVVSVGVLPPEYSVPFNSSASAPDEFPGPSGDIPPAFSESVVAVSVVVQP